MGEDNRLVSFPVLKKLASTSGFEEGWRLEQAIAVTKHIVTWVLVANENRQVLATVVTALQSCMNGRQDSMLTVFTTDLRVLKVFG